MSQPFLLTALSLLSRLGPSTRAILVFAGCAVLSGCSSGLSAVSSSLTFALSPNAAVTGARLDPRYQYLRVVYQDRIAFLARGVARQTAEGFKEVYYSAERETLTLINGHLVSFSGPQKSYLLEFVERKSQSASQFGHEAESHRQLSILPDGPLHRTVAVTRRAVPATPKLRESPVRYAKGSLLWVQEDYRTGETRYSNYLGYDTNQTLVYSEQCLTRDFCLSLERWSPTGS